MHNANYYLPLLSPEATQAVLMVAGGIYATREKLSEWPIESKEKPFWLSELLFTAIFHGHSTSAYRLLTRSNFDSVQMQIEKFMWDEYRHVHRYSSEVSRLFSDMPNAEILLDYLMENTDFELYLMDAQEYAEAHTRRDLKSKGLIFTKDIMTDDEFKRDEQKYKIQNKGIKTHHLLLSALADCGCCPFKATALSNKLFPGTAGEIYYDCRWPKAPASDEDWC